MAKKASTRKTNAGPRRKKGPAKGTRKRTTGNSRAQTGSGSSASETFVSLLQSPLVADLVAVAATSALAALAQEGFSRSGASGGKRAGNAVKKAGKAAADAVKRRLSEEIDAIKSASKAAKGAKTTKA